MLATTYDCYILFEQYINEFESAKDFSEFCVMVNKTHLERYYWVELSFYTMKAGKKTNKPLIVPNASKFSDLFTNAILIETNNKHKPIDTHYVSGDAGLSKFCGGIRGYSKTTPDIRSHYGAKFYGTYVTPNDKTKELIKTYCCDKNYSFEAIRRKDGILITVKPNSYPGCSWLALLDSSDNVDTLFDEETRQFLERERKAEIEAWGE